jgi:hypothetical protein
VAPVWRPLLTPPPPWSPSLCPTQDEINAAVKQAGFNLDAPAVAAMIDVRAPHCRVVCRRPPAALQAGPEGQGKARGSEPMQLRPNAALATTPPLLHHHHHHHHHPAQTAPTTPPFHYAPRNLTPTTRRPSPWTSTSAPASSCRPRREPLPRLTPTGAAPSPPTSRSSSTAAATCDEPAGRWQRAGAGAASSHFGSSLCLPICRHGRQRRRKGMGAAACATGDAQ